MRRIYSTIALVLISSFLFAQEPVGTWYGNLNLKGLQLPLVFHITKNGTEYSTKMDSPNQRAIGMPTSKTTLEINILTIEATNIGMKYTGVFMPDSNKINGIFEQGPTRAPLTLSNKPNTNLLVKSGPRPQDPKDFPYKQEEITFTNANGGHTLAGTLTLPADGKASKIVVLISGSGPQDRNEESPGLNHRPFLVLSDALTRQGIAVLRYDDRGVGKSTGVFQMATSADFADDAEAAVKYILSRPELKEMSIGLIGHSEGGMIAPMVASRNSNVKFIVSMAAPAIPIFQLFTQQLESLQKQSGMSAAKAAQEAAINLKIFATIKNTKNLPLDQASTEVEQIYRKELSQQTIVKPDSAAIEANFKQTINSLKMPWFRYFIAFDPAEYLTKVQCPVLAINGKLDYQVSAKENLAAIKAGLEKAGNKNFEIVPMEGLNHLFQKAITGYGAEYEKIEETINPAVLHKIATWINSI
ncbi:MAG: alpha/beta hydrolase [Pedobacter sp.]|uniref:alpha/beta hydrolase family protein n=1 Tax=Pedobacter sp. TaxID=1411316 RepID=UPI003564971F